MMVRPLLNTAGMKALVTLASLFALTSVAAAESYDATQPAPKSGAYVSLDTTIMGLRSVHLGGGIGGGMRLKSSPLFVRGAVLGGPEDASGSFQQVRAGLEGRGCFAREWLCAFGGLDVGYGHEHAITRPLFSNETMETDAHDFLILPRVGVEAGKVVKLRLALEMPVMERLDEDEDVKGIALTGGLGVAF